MIDTKYRPDVDGLRAVAVTLVLLFHAGLGFTGGFIGVDVFFVISGFLITGLILKEHHVGHFSMANFWVRRICRIIPAATVMVIAVLFAGFLLLLPGDYADLSKSAICQQLLFSNFYFWRHTGYFDGSAELKPLLHTWSLAIEEQFYLGYPFLLLFLNRHGRYTSAIVLGVIALFSFCISHYGITHHPSATFYLLPTRAWELLIGGLICFVPAPTRIPQWVLSLLSWTSVSAIMTAGWCFTPLTPFPGLNALVPCGAAFLLIYCNSLQLSLPAALLASKPFVFVGLLSYSLYLWHWPVFAFWKHWLDHPNPFKGAALLGLSAILAYLSWRFVETPFRLNTRSVPPRIHFVGALVATFVVTGLSLIVTASHGLPSRFSDATMLIVESSRPARNLECTIEKAEQGDFPFVGTKEPATHHVLFWGDSHLGCLVDVIDESLRKHGVRGVVATRGGMPPLLDAWCIGRKREDIDRWNKAVFRYIQDNHIYNVVLIARWSVYIEGSVTGDNDMLIADADSNTQMHDFAETTVTRSLNRTLMALQATGARVWVMKQVPSQKEDPTKQLVLATIFHGGDRKGASLDWNSRQHLKSNRLIDELAASGAKVIDPWPYCFDTERNSAIFDGSRSFYRDNNHLSAYGAKYLLSELFEAVTLELTRDPRVE